MSDMKSTKPHCIAKRTVWEAYQQVKANRGAAGIDDESITMFEQNLSRNLYKLWNRMSSGSYFPPPVKQVEIPKAKGGTRKLGIPTVNADYTGPQFGFGMGGDLSSVSPTSRPAL
jgi:retron-type reverse transcriptase